MISQLYCMACGRVEYLTRPAGDHFFCCNQKMHKTGLTEDDIISLGRQTGGQSRDGWVLDRMKPGAVRITRNCPADCDSCWRSELHRRGRFYIENHLWDRAEMLVCV